MSARLPSDALDTLFRLSGDAIIGIDARGLVDAWSPAAERIFGWAAADVVGFRPPSAALPQMDPGIRELRAHTRDGKAIELELRTTPRESGGLLIMVSDRSRLRDESRFRELLEAAPDAIIEVDRSGRIVLVNRVAEGLFGYSREELLRMNVDALIPAAMHAGHAGHRADYWRNPTTRPMGRDMVLSARRHDGSDIPVEISLSPVRSEDGFHVTAIIRDVTERRVAEEKIRTTNQELAERNHEIEKADRLKSEFLASMSHELRTPLHTIIGFTELLAEQLEGPLNHKQQRFVEHVHNDSIHLLDLINDILDLSKIESGRMDLDIHVVDASEMLRDTLNGIAPSANAKNILIENRVTGSIEVLADRIRLREIFTNLLSNAIKFTPGGGGISIDARTEDGAKICFSVRDNGIGIAVEDQAVVFDKFRQVASTTRGVREGTGLGLAITKHLVEMHGGTLDLKSALGEGSCFSFTIPVESSAPSGIALPAVAPLVLIIEDEPAARELIAGYLNPLGIATEFATSASGATALAKRLKPDAITLDLLMPGRSGWRVLAELRATPETSAIPILVMSVLDRDPEALSLGATDYLQKPVGKDTLVRALSHHVPSVRAALTK